MRVVSKIDQKHITLELCIDGTCYHFHPEAKNFEDAQKDCLRRNQKLFEPKNQNEYNQVINYAKNLKNTWDTSIYIPLTNYEI